MFRLIGTCAGALVSIGMVALYGQASLPFLLLMALWLAFCTAGASLLHNHASYGFVLAGYTAAIVALPASADPATVFDQAVARCSEIGLGILCAALVNVLLWPRRLERQLANQGKAAWEAGLQAAAAELRGADERGELLAALGRDRRGGRPARPRLVRGRARPRPFPGLARARPRPARPAARGAQGGSRAEAARSGQRARLAALAGRTRGTVARGPPGRVRGLPAALAPGAGRGAWTVAPVPGLPRTPARRGEGGRAQRRGAGLWRAHPPGAGRHRLAPGHRARRAVRPAQRPGVSLRGRVLAGQRLAERVGRGVDHRGGAESLRQPRTTRPGPA
ncbi:fusaric acid resistance protein [Pseudomonas aeruginosa]|nr:fusaric acid resistance protein [Pseudomonas aeruginosa]